LERFLLWLYIFRPERNRSAEQLFKGNLNDDRQGEGGTLAVIKVNITTRIYFMQEFFLKK
jgi:hypothetical protein